MGGKEDSPQKTGPNSQTREDKSVHDHHRKKIFGGTFLAGMNSFPGRWWIEKPYKKNRKTISTTKIFHRWPAFLRQREVPHWSRCMLSFSQHPPPPRILQNLWGSAGAFCGTFCIVQSQLNNPHTEPQRFYRTLGAKPSFSDPANSAAT